MNKFVTTIIVVLALGVGLVIGHSFWPKTVAAASNPVGTVENSAKFAGITVSLANPGTVGATGANGTSTTITNTDSSDRYVTSWKAVCQGVGTSQTAYSGAGLAALQMTIATTTGIAPATIAYNNAIAVNFTMATTSPNLFISSSTTATASTSNAMLWRAGENITFYTNATNTAVCKEGVDYIQS